MQVAIPIPKPEGYASADRYKIQFTFDGAHIWLQPLKQFKASRTLRLLLARLQNADAIVVKSYAAHKLKGAMHYISYQRPDQSVPAAALPDSDCDAICRGSNGDPLAEAAGEGGA